MTTSTCCYKPPHPLSLSLIAFRRRLLTAGGAFRRGGKPNPELTSSDVAKAATSTIPELTGSTARGGIDAL
jgi:hypothetical protein